MKERAEELREFLTQRGQSEVDFNSYLKKFREHRWRTFRDSVIVLSIIAFFPLVFWDGGIATSVVLATPIMLILDMFVDHRIYRYYWDECRRIRNKHNNAWKHSGYYDGKDLEIHNYD